MDRKNKPEEIVAKLRQVDVLTLRGATDAVAIHLIGVTRLTYFRWRMEFDGKQTARTRIHDPIAVEADNELTFKPDQLAGTGQACGDALCILPRQDGQVLWAYAQFRFDTILVTPRSATRFQLPSPVLPKAVNAKLVPF